MGINRSQSGNISSLVSVLLFIVLLLGLGLVGYLYYQQRTDNQELNREINELKTSISDLGSQEDQSADSANSADSNETQNKSSIVTGQVTQDSSDSHAVVDCYVLAGSVDSLYVNYGVSNDLGSSTPKQSDELALGEPDAYGRFAVIIKASELKDGSQYFYQCAGEKDNKQIKAGIASFDAKK